MYPFLLALHSINRWFVLFSLLFSIYRGYKGWKSRAPFSRFDNFLRHTTATFAYIQFVFGIWLYFISPITQYFLQNFSTAVHQREIRFFGMEHSTVMLLGITLITIGSIKAKRKPTDTEKYKTMTIWYTIALIVILTSIPWGFSPLVRRPYLRGL